MTAECQRQAVEIERLRGKLEEASVGREVDVVIIIIALAMAIDRHHLHCPRHHRRHLHHQGTLVWRVAGVEARMREARSSQGLELVGVITIMMVINWSLIMVTLVTIVTTAYR